MRLALAIDKGFSEAETVLPVELAVARVLADFVATDVLIVPLRSGDGVICAARLLAVEKDEGGDLYARLGAGQRIGRAGDLRQVFAGPFPLQLLSEEDYAAIVLKAAAASAFMQAEATPIGEMTERTVDFSHLIRTEETTVRAVLETLRRETGSLCALTGAPVFPGTLPVAIRLVGADRLHLNNLLLLSSSAEEAFRGGHFTIRDDLSIIVDFSRIDPELLETINPVGRLRVPDNAALRPAPENLAWHRRVVFGLA